MNEIEMDDATEEELADLIDEDVALTLNDGAMEMKPGRKVEVGFNRIEGTLDDVATNTRSGELYTLSLMSNDEYWVLYTRDVETIEVL